MNSSSLVITSIADQNNAVLKQYATEAAMRNVSFIVIGDTKSPAEFHIEGCDFYSIDKQLALPFGLAKIIPKKHYARKNLGYLVAIAQGAESIIETDDDNLPIEGFWDQRNRKQSAKLAENTGWTNVYKYFTDVNIWPRGFALEEILKPLPVLAKVSQISSPIQQGLADENPDIDAIYRLTLPLPITFSKAESIALGKNAICPFNSQNTTWFKEAFPLMYLPSHCSFRMTDIWRSFIAQRISWECDWLTLFHSSTVRQERNEHNLIHDFQDEISGYLNNSKIYECLKNLRLSPGEKNISGNMLLCYKALIDLELIGTEEMPLIKAWLADLKKLKS